MKRAHTIAIALFGPVITLGTLSGCRITTDSPDRGDAAPQTNYCTSKVEACYNSCNKADLGLGCKICCDRNGADCDVGANYNFFACPNSE